MSNAVIRRGVLLAVFVIVFIGACAASDKSGNNSPWKSAIDARRESFTDYEWEVLQDYQVSDAELRDAKEKTATCMQDKGYDYEFFWPYGARLSVPKDMDPAKADREYDDCYIGVSMQIASFHNEMRANPHNEDYDQLVVACLVRDGVVEKTFTVDVYKDSTSVEYPSERVRRSVGWISCEQNPTDNPDLHEYVESLTVGLE